MESRVDINTLQWPEKEKCYTSISGLYRDKQEMGESWEPNIYLRDIIGVKSSDLFWKLKVE